MIEKECITLEDGINYIVLETKEYNNNKYYYLVNENDKKDYCIRKLLKEEDTEYIVPLDNSKEFDEMLRLFNSGNL